jgi:hypothetical protein
LSLEECLARLRYVKYGDEVLSSDHNTKVECLRLLRDRIVELADRLGVRGLIDPKLGRLDAILAMLKYRVALDIIDPEDHNLLVDGLKAARDALAELEAVTVAPPPPPPPAPPPAPPRAGLWYRMSAVRVESPDGSLVDDTESVLTFTLPEDSYVLVVYNASNRHGSREYRLGKYGYVNVDGIILYDTRCDKEPYWDNYADSITCTWAGRLTAGAHTVKGVFAGGVTGYTVGVDVRQIVVLAVPVSSGPLAYGVVALSALSYVRGYPVEDPHARLLLNLGDEAGVLAIYNASKMYGWASERKETYAVMFVNGLPVPESRVDQSIYYANEPLGLTSVAFMKLGAGVHSLSGRFANTYVTTRTLAYVMAPREWVSAGRMSSVRVEGSYLTMGSPPPWDDPEAVVTVDLPEDSMCLALYSVSNSPDSIESIFGKFTLINVDGVDVPESFASQSPVDYNFGNSVLSLWAGRLTAGSHTFKGRWGSNEPLETTGIDRRVIAVICIPESLLI